MVRAKKDIFIVLKKNRNNLRRMGVKRLGVFGSYARGTAHDASDVDFLVSLESRTFDAYMDLKFYLEKLLHAQVDLVLPETLKPRIRQHILKETVYVE